MRGASLLTEYREVSNKYGLEAQERRLAMNEHSTVKTSQTIGEDLGDRTSELCVLDAKGQVERRLRMATTAEAVQRTFEGLAACRVVMEAGTHSPWMSRLLQARGHEVVVANPRKVRLIGASISKDDQRDAELLARLGRVDVKLLAPIQHRGAEVQRDRALLQVRGTLVQMRSMLINQVRGLAKSHGQRVPKCSAESFPKHARATLEGELFLGQALLLEHIETLTQSVRGLDRRLEQMCTQDYPETLRLRQITGVGPITSLTFVLSLETPSRFRRSRSVGAYLGLRPKRRDSGERRPELRITKAGDSELRQLLVQCAHYILGPFGPDCDLRRFGERLIAQGGKRAKKRARVAVARKLAVLLHALWRSGEHYEPLRHASALAA